MSRGIRSCRSRVRWGCVVRVTIALEMRILTEDAVVVLSLLMFPSFFHDTFAATAATAGADKCQPNDRIDKYTVFAPEAVIGTPRSSTRPNLGSETTASSAAMDITSHR